MAWCVALGRMRSLVGSCRVAHDVERKAVMEGAAAALRLLERCARRPEQRARAARRLVRVARAAIARGDFRRAQTLLDVLEALARDGTLGGGGARLYDAFVHFVWWVASRGAPYARQALEALALVCPPTPIPFGGAEHALCLELAKLVKAGLTIRPVPAALSPVSSMGAVEDGGGDAAVTVGAGIPDAAGNGSGVGGGSGNSAISGATPSRDAEVARAALAESALRAMVRVLQNAPVRCVRANFPSTCFRAGLPAALRACAGASSGFSNSEGEAALRALARAAPETRPADFVQPLLTSLLNSGSLERPGPPARVAAAALAAVGAAAAPVVLFAALRAVRIYFWNTHRRCIARRYCDGDLAAEADLRDVCTSVGGAVLAALRGLRSSPSPPDVDAALLQQAAMTLAIETQVAPRESGPSGEALFAELLAEILPLSNDLYRTPPRVAADDNVAAAFKKLLPWQPAEEVLRAALAHGVGAAATVGTRLRGVADRIADSVAQVELMGMDWPCSSSSSLQDRDQGSTSTGSVDCQKSDDDALLRKARSLYYHLVAPSPSPESPIISAPRRRRSSASPNSAPSSPPPCVRESATKVPPPQPPSPPKGLGSNARDVKRAAARRHKRRRTHAQNISSPETSPLASPGLNIPSSGRHPAVETDESWLLDSYPREKLKHDPLKLVPEAAAIVSKKGCLLALSDEPCVGCMAVVNEMQHQFPHSNQKLKAAEEDYTWANIQQELIWAEITKQTAEFQGNHTETKDLRPEHILDWQSNWSSVSAFR